MSNFSSSVTAKMGVLLGDVNASRRVGAASSGGGSATASTTVDCSNCSANPWTLQTAVPANIMDQAVGSVGSNVYMFSGISNGAFTNAARKYDSVANVDFDYEFPGASRSSSGGERRHAIHLHYGRFQRVRSPDNNYSL